MSDTQTRQPEPSLFLIGTINASPLCKFCASVCTPPMHPVTALKKEIMFIVCETPDEPGQSTHNGKGSQMKALFMTAAVTALLLTGCASDDQPTASSGEGTMQVAMVDAPASAYDSIVVTVTEVSVHSNAAAGGWITLSTGARNVNLLRLVNGVEEVMGEAKLAAGLYSQMRLTLGDSCWVYSNGARITLKVPSGEIKLNIHAEIMANVTTKMVLDFDAGRSLVMTASGLVMKPVIRVLTTSSAGYIQGSVNVRSSVMAYGNGDTLGTVTGTNNSFKIMYAKPGTYSVTVISGNAMFYDTTLANISVVSGQTTNVGMITLRAKL